MNKTESQNQDTTPILIPLEANLPTEVPTSTNDEQEPQSNPDSDDQDPLSEPEHEEEDESRPSTDLGPTTISSSLDQGRDKSPSTSGNFLQDAAPGSTSHQEGSKSPDRYTTNPTLRNITLGIFSCMTLMMLLHILAPTTACQGVNLAARALDEANLFSVLKYGPRILESYGNVTELARALLNFAVRGAGLTRP